jgi:acetolactate synthase small subunit
VLVQKEREHLNAIVRVLSDRALRVETLNRMATESPIIYDQNVQKSTVEEALEEAVELRGILDEVIALLEKDRDEELEVFVGQK